MKKTLSNFIPNGEITQNEWIILRLVRYGNITRNQCLRTYISRLSSYMCTLSKVYTFETSNIEIINYWGKSKDYKYSITEESKKRLIQDNKDLIEKYFDMDFDYNLYV